LGLVFAVVFPLTDKNEIDASDWNLDNVLNVVGGMFKGFGIHRVKSGREKGHADVKQNHVRGSLVVPINDSRGNEQDGFHDGKNKDTPKGEKVHWQFVVVFNVVLVIGVGKKEGAVEANIQEDCHDIDQKPIQPFFDNAKFVNIVSHLMQLLSRQGICGCRFDKEVGGVTSTRCAHERCGFTIAELTSLSTQRIKQLKVKKKP